MVYYKYINILNALYINIYKINIIKYSLYIYLIL